MGVYKPVIIGHEMSNVKAIKNIINIAAKMIEKDITGLIKVIFNA